MAFVALAAPSVQLARPSAAADLHASRSAHVGLGVSQRAASAERAPLTPEFAVTCSASSSSPSPARRAFVAAVGALLVGFGSVVPDAPWVPPALAVQESGRKKEVTRGLDLQNENFDGQDYSGKNFQTSLLRGASFKGAKLRGSNFFDADISNVDFEGADLTEAILELSNVRESNFTNAILVNAFVSSNTKWDGATIDGADFTGVILRKDAQKYLCSIATGTNATTGVSTAESLGCQ